MKQHYIHALTDLIISGSDPRKLLSNFRDALTRRGHERLLRPVLLGVIKAFESKSVSDRAIVTLVSKSAKVHEGTIREVLQKIGSDGMDYTVTEDPSLIGGFKAAYKHTSVDQSYKRALVSLYEAIRSK